MRSGPVKILGPAGYRLVYCSILKLKIFTLFHIFLISIHQRLLKEITVSTKNIKY